uniref:Uncharacterized protein n=1 Tax=Acrobeloides nanus TaxID=290746 RepID=A0A914CXV0_9BILA
MAIQENFLDSFYCLDLDDIEPVSEQKPNCSKLSNYTAFDNSDEWFLKTTPENIDGLDKREFLHSVASYYYSNGKFALAYEKFCELLNVGGHNRACRLSILDSMIRCLIKETSQNLDSIKPSLEQHLQEIEPLVSTYEEKITEARKHVCFDLEKISSECTNLADQPPPHKVKNTGSARNRQEQEKIFEDFMKKFSWLFVDNVNFLNGLK